MAHYVCGPVDTLYDCVDVICISSLLSFLPSSRATDVAPTVRFLVGENGRASNERRRGRDTEQNCNTNGIMRQKGGNLDNALAAELRREKAI